MEEPSSPRRLSVGATILGLLLVLVVVVIGRIVTMLSVAIATGRVDPHAPERLAEVADGVLLAAGILGASAAGGLTLWALLRRRAPRAYLGLTRPTLPALGVGVLATLALVAIFDALRWITTGAVVPAAWLEMMTPGALPWLVLAVVVAAPIFEEVLFRGYLHRGLAESRLGPVGAIAVISVLFMLVHFPGDLVSALEPLASGVLLGVFRERTGSITAGIVMHAIGNLHAILLVTLA